MSLINQMLKDLEQRGATSIDVKTNSATLLNSPAILGNKKKNNPLMLYLFIGLFIIIVATIYFNFGKNRTQVPANDVVASKETPAVTINDVPVTPAPEVNLDTPPVHAIPPVSTLPETSVAAGTSVKINDTESELPKPVLIADGKINTIPKATPPTEVKPQAQKEASQTSSEPIQASAQNNPAHADRSVAKSNQTTTIQKEIRPEQKSLAYYQQAILKLQQGRVTEAQADLAQALESNPKNHEARLTYASLLLDNKRHTETKDLLAKGLIVSPEQNEFRIALARLQVDAGDPTALNTLEEGRPYGNNNADYQSFFAAMLQRANRHDDAIAHYKAALALTANAPNHITASSLIGLGISLQATEQLEDAKQAFTRVKQNHALSPDLAQFVEQRLKQINQRLQQR